MNLFRAFLTVSGLTLLSRVLGVIRDIVINYYLGVGAKSDAWNSAFQFPNLFRRIFGEGAFNSAFVPLYAGKLASGKDEAFDFGSRTLVALALILAGVFVFCMIFTWPLMKLFNWGYSPEKLDLTVTLARISMGYLIFVCLLAALSGILNSHNKFFAATFSYCTLNIVFLVGFWGFIPIFKDPIKVIAWSSLISGLVQLLVVLIPAYRMGFRVKFKLPRWDADLKQLSILMLPGLLSAGIQQVNLLVGGWVVSFEDGGRTILYNADRIHQLPLGLIGIAFGVVLLPEISRLLKNQQLMKAKASLNICIKNVMFFCLPASVAMVVLAEPILFVLFKDGQFTSEAAIAGGQSLALFAIGCPAYVLTRVLQPGYFGRQDTKTPMKYTAVSAITNAVLCIVAFLFFRKSGNLHVACAAATSIAGWVNAILLIRGLNQLEMINLRARFWKKMAKMLLASAVMGVGIALVASWLDSSIHSDSRLWRTSVFLLVVSYGITLYLVVSHFTDAMSLRELKNGFVRSEAK
jgi:putative peptidoglycan lipid II flippase